MSGAGAAWRGRLVAALDAPGRPSSDHDLNTAAVRPANRILRDAAVLVALIDGAQGPEVLLTKRSSRLKHHPGQVAFPGGKLEPGDADAAAAALREAEEEVGLPRARVEVLGALAPHETVTGFLVTPILALAPQVKWAAEDGEVAEVFTVPFPHVADPARYAIERRRWRGTWRSYYAIPYGPYYVWGATACMLRALADRIPP